ncbi:MAG: V-type ATPase 116kDa subunit family protein, partial [Candidatus Anstonellales archaeon]
PKKRIEELRPNIKILSKEKQTLIEMLNNEKEKIKDLYYSLLLEKDRAEISRFFSGTKSIYIIEGWVPHNDYEALKNDILSKFENNVLIEEISDMEHGHSDFPPTLIKSPKTIKNYELAYSFSSLPRGDEFNAAFFYFLTFPIFYGMIIGDVGYSLISIIIALLIKNLFKSSKMLNNICNIWLFSSLAGIAWGLIFDEWFGSSHVFWLEKLKSYGLIKEANAYYQGLSRLHNFNDLLFLCIILGTSHVMLGYLLSIINAYMHKDKKHMLASTGWFLGFSSIITYALTSNVLMSALIFVSGVVLVLLNEGLFGLMELPSFFSVPASYLRIAAIGIAGVIIAEIINTGLPSELNLINIFILLILLLLHIFNAFIAMFESTIQAGRLQILEFGLRFNKGGGYEYKPFMLKRGEKYGS